MKKAVVVLLFIGSVVFAEDKPAAVSQEDLERYNAAAQRVAMLKREIADAETILNQQAEIIRLRYGIGEQDKLTPQGQIVRAPKKPEKPEKPELRGDLTLDEPEKPTKQ
jgi:hypothetical protein